MSRQNEARPPAEYGPWTRGNAGRVGRTVTTWHSSPVGWNPVVDWEDASHLIHDPPCPDGGYTEVSRSQAGYVGATRVCPLCGATLIVPEEFERYVRSLGERFAGVGYHEFKEAGAQWMLDEMNRQREAQS